MKKFVTVLLFTCSVLLFPLPTFASASVSYQTQTLSADGRLIETQTAYQPIGLFAPNSHLVNPEDIYIDQYDQVYIADAGSKKVAVFDLAGNQIRLIGEGILERPTGIFVDGKGDIFVSDYQKEKVFRFSQNGHLLKEYGKPDSPLFGSHSPYKPQKIGVDRRGNLYVVSEGSTNGMIQLSQDGTFLGYYGVNRTSASLPSFLQNLITSEQQKARLFKKIPPAPNNIAIDEQGLLYSITAGTKQEVIKKLNVAGSNLLPPGVSKDSSLQDITVGTTGNLFVINSSGRIYEYDSYGNLLFVFGGKDDGTNRLGLFKQSAGIEADRFGRLYVTDRERGMVQVLEPTAFARQVHEGIALFKEGLYVESKVHWQKVLEQNSLFGLAHTAMGKAYFKQQRYEEAMQEYWLAENRQGYSDAYWEVRHQWMQQNLGSVFLTMMGLVFFRSVVLYYDKKKNILQFLRDIWGNVKRRKRISQLLFLFRFFRHPIDSFYELKHENRASLISATILYVVYFFEYLFIQYQTGFIFSARGLAETSLLSVVLQVFAPLLLFVAANYLVSTINDGEGRLRDVYIGTIYSLAPFLVFSVPITLLSNLLTLNESFVYVFSTQIMMAWSLLNLVLMIKEIHQYSVSETVRNILLTLFGMVILVLVVFILYVLLDQVYNFIYSIVQEVMHRV